MTPDNDGGSDLDNDLSTVPMAAPDNVQVHVINSTLANVHWEPVFYQSVRGHLKGYKVTLTN